MTADRKHAYLGSGSSDAPILLLLSRILPSSGLYVSEVAARIRRPPSETPRAHTAYITRLLVDMERRGMVRRRDETKPILWQITEEGRKNV